MGLLVTSHGTYSEYALSPLNDAYLLKHFTHLDSVRCRHVHWSLFPGQAMEMRHPEIDTLHMNQICRLLLGS